MLHSPLVPFIRESDFAIRKPWSMPERRLLDYLLIYVQEGTCKFTVDRVEYAFKPGEFCLIQPGSVNKLQGLTNTVTPFAHFDLFYNASRLESFPTRAGQIDLSDYAHLMQPRLDELCGCHIPVKLEMHHPDKFRTSFLQAVELWQYRDAHMQARAQAHLTSSPPNYWNNTFPHLPRPDSQVLPWTG
ncbi:AraC family ligand binding domain-containing protein [Paenibacillus sp. N3.4]|uniref:AraC family ligand binding domain-containing protein n=1 Tax=Paenibacillus sp. N3.4 TaxID=2603222 RepID=UPI0011C8DF24|nr:AraC family ligand binding domain-containing protein [Paenibacillus sp. N3.4]TXK72272.1 hypothetical protein FU659_31640 [Paenibacillus sp. N3.4]